MTKDELRLANYHLEYLKKQRKYFEYADTSQNLLEQQKENDLLLLQESFVAWIQKLKSEDDRKKDLTLLLESIWRIQSYCGSLETICKSSVSKIVDLNKQLENLHSEKRLLELEIIQLNAKHKLEKDNLGKEIEFITNNSKS